MKKLLEKLLNKSIINTIISFIVGSIVGFGVSTGVVKPEHEVVLTEAIEAVVKTGIEKTDLLDKLEEENPVPDHVEMIEVE